jgi:Flp pilus assembly protein TadG
VTVRSADLKAHRSRGTAAVLVCITLIALLSFASLTVDVGMMYIAKADLQRAADAAALGAAARLLTRGGGEDPLAEARAVAIGFVEANPVFGRQVTIVPATDLVFGQAVLDEVTNDYVFTPTEIDPNAVQVTVRLSEESPNGTLPLMFSQVFTDTCTSISATAIATTNIQPVCRMWAKQEVKLSGGSSTDSYRSDDGPYDPLFALAKGDVCSCEKVDLSGDSVVDGSAFHGPDHSVNAPELVTGNVAQIAECLDLAPDFGDVVWDNDNGLIGLSDDGEDPLSGGDDRFELSGGDHITLVSGTYYFTEFKLSGGSVVSVSGPTTIYVAGNITVSGGGVLNLGQDPEHLMIICSGTTINWSGTSNIYGTILASTADITLSGGGDLCGAVVSKKVELSGGSNFHADQSLPFNGDLVAPPALIR